MTKNDTKFKCDERCADDDVMCEVRRQQPSIDEATNLEMFFKVFGDKTRLRILLALSVSEQCVCHLCDILDLKQSTVSQQMRILRQSRIVKTRQAGKNVYYSLDDNHIGGILQMGFDHIREKY